MKHFELSEFDCKCGCADGKGRMDGTLLARIDDLREAYGKAMVINCGYRCPKHNAEVGGAKNSTHLLGEATDIRDIDGSLKKWLTVELLEKFDLYMESPMVTKTWVHLQTRPTINRIFKP